MNDEILEQHLRKLSAPELPETWRAEILSTALREARAHTPTRKVWPPVLVTLRNLFARNPVTASALTALWLLIFLFKASTPVDPSERNSSPTSTPTGPFISSRSKTKSNSPSFCRISRNKGKIRKFHETLLRESWSLFWSWGFLKFILWAVTLIILFYVEEDWRGARAWAATKAEWEAKGETFDFDRLIPPPIPEDQNLAMIPLFKLEPDPKNRGDLAPLVLQRALRDDLPGNNLIIPHSGNWQAGQLPDMEKIREVVASDYVEAFKTASTSNDALAQFDAIYPFLADLRTAATARVYCRFLHDYPPQPPYDFLRMVTVQIQIAKVLNFHAILALDAHKPDLALEDIKTSFKLISGLRQEPFLVSGLVAIGMTAIDGKGAIYDGLALHSWDDAQLADLQNELAKTDFLSNYQHVLRGEIGVAIPAYDNLKSNRSRLADVFKTHDENKDQKPKMEGWNYIPNFWADGWLDLWKVRAVNFDLNAVGFIDPKSRLVFPKTVDQFAAGIELRQHSWDAYAPWNIMSGAAAGPIANAVLQFSEIQVWLDQARIVCALERYRLVHGIYPESLDALVPACIDDLPHDIMNGQPYHYRLRVDGAYLLYSVGWNQTDDGGKVVYKNDAPTQIDYHQGDWVWPTPK